VHRQETIDTTVPLPDGSGPHKKMMNLPLVGPTMVWKAKKAFIKEVEH